MSLSEAQSTCSVRASGFWGRKPVTWSPAPSETRCKQSDPAPVRFIDAIRAEDRICFLEIRTVCAGRSASQASFYGLEGNQQLPVPRITEYVPQRATRKTPKRTIGLSSALRCPFGSTKMTLRFMWIVSSRPSERRGP